jgi:hypothetical protein
MTPLMIFAAVGAYALGCFKTAALIIIVLIILDMLCFILSKEAK